MRELPSAADRGPDEGLRDLITLGAEIVGGAAAGAIGFILAGPAGGAVGAALAGGTRSAISDVLKNVGEEISERLLGPRERVRIGATLAICAIDIQDRIKRGETLRNDGFFDAKYTGRSDADEIVEAVLLKAQREAEEKKMKHLGYLLSGFAFDGTVGVAMAHQLIKIAEQLTYRQLCLMRLAATKLSGLRMADYRKDTAIPYGVVELLYECMDLYYRGLVTFGGTALLGLTDVVPGKMAIVAFGQDLFRLMRLSDIPEQDFLPLLPAMRA